MTATSTRTEHLDQLVHLSPSQLEGHARNTRKVFGDLAGLKASIVEVGIVEPIVVTPNGDGFHILAGRRRVAAAAELGLETVPCIVRHAEDREAVTAALVENLQRKDLTTAEEAEAFTQLAAFGLDVGAIAGATGAAEVRITRGLAVAKSKTATATAERFDLTLDQAAAVAEFDDDAGAVKEITVTAAKRPEQLDHLLSRLRQDRAADAARETEVAKLRTAKVAIVVQRPGYQRSGPCALEELKDAKGKNLTAANHKTCPGHAAHVARPRWDGKIVVTYLCTEPVKHGHQSRYGGGGTAAPKSKDQTPAAKEKASKERRALIANNKAWRAATPVRRRYVAELLQRKVCPAGTLAYVTRELVAYTQQGTEHAEGMLRELLAVPKTKTAWGAGFDAAVAKAEASPEKLLPLVLLARVAAGRESSMGVHTWRSSHPEAARYLTYLESTGYALSDVERIVIDVAKGKAARG